MTDEEMAVNWIRSQGWSEENLPSDEFSQMFQAFLAALKAGRPKWHNLQENPNDLPKVNQKVLLQIKGEDEPIMDFYRQDGLWNFANKYEVIAWCEIPKYTEE